jgi:hypothetical protein
MTLTWLLAAVAGVGGVAVGVERALAALDGPASAAAGTVPEVGPSTEPERAAERGSYLGFDTSIYPGDDAMRSWRKHAKYDWVGYYLPAPCHKDGSWQGKRATLEAMGWGVAVVYVGQQTWGRTPR